MSGMTRSEPDGYALRIISVGSTIDRETDPHGRTIYMIETWTFVADAGCLADWVASEPEPAACWDDWYVSIEAYRREQERRIAARADWEKRVKALLTGKREDRRALQWEFARVFSEVFMAVRIQIAHDAEGLTGS